MDKRLVVRLAKDSSEVEAAQRLRFEVFNLEMQKGLKSSWQSRLDRDKYDSLCDHLIALEKEGGRVIGTYRLLHGERLESKNSFYSATEFDLSGLQSRRNEMLEMGRFCIAAEYRQARVTRLLWQGVLRYSRSHGIRYLMGCSSLFLTDHREISRVFSFLKKHHFSPDGFRVVPWQKCRFKGLDGFLDVGASEREVLLILPALVRSYLKMGAQICGEPALDNKFGSVDFFTLLDLTQMKSEYFDRLRI